MIIDKHAPIRSMRASNKYCPWINKDLRGLIREREKLKKEAVEHNFSPLMEFCRKIRNKANRMNINLKKDSISRKKLSKLRVTW